MKIDLLFDPFGPRDRRAGGATAAEGEGFDGVWLYDHLAGSVHGESRVLEAWTTLTAIAATVPGSPSVDGPQCGQPPAGTLGVMAATLQEVSGAGCCSGSVPAAAAVRRMRGAAGLRQAGAGRRGAARRG